MSSIDSLGSASTTASGTNRTAGYGALSAEQFLDILISELRNQNPLEPMKNNELMSQMTQIKSLEATTKLVEELETLTSGMKLGSGAQLIGKLVSGKAANGLPVLGKVQGLVVEDGNVSLVVEGYPLLPMDNVEEVVEEVVGEDDDGS